MTHVTVNSCDLHVAELSVGGKLDAFLCERTCGSGKWSGKGVCGLGISYVSLSQAHISPILLVWCAVKINTISFRLN